MACLAISLMGSLEVHLDTQGGSTTAIPGLEASKPGALLAYLALETGTPPAAPAVARQTLAALLWSERGSAQALSSLRFALSNLRAALESGHTGMPFVLVDRRRVGLNPQASIWVDVIDFQQQAAQLLAGQRAGQAFSLPALQSALALHRGSFLHTLPLNDSLEFEAWVLAWRERLDHSRRQLLALLALGCEQAGQLLEAEAAYRSIVAQCAWDEAAQRQLMQFLARSGQRSAALAQYEIHCQALRAELGVEPERETTQLYQKIKRQTSAVLPPALPAVNVPDRRVGTPFVARGREMQSLEMALEALLAGQGQTVLVTGEAGSGKTALLSEFARRSLARRPDLLVVGGRCNAYSGLGQPYLPFIESVQMLAGEWDLLPWAASLDQEHEARLKTALPLVAQTLVDVAPMLLDRFVGRAALIQRLAQAPGAKPAWLAALRQGHADAGRIPAPRPNATLEAGALFEQYTRLLGALTRHSPLLLLLDDLQWIDPGSAALLFHLARRCAGSQVLIAAAYRSGEVTSAPDGSEHPLHGVLAELRRLPGSVQIDLDQADEHSFVAAFLEHDPFLQPHRLDGDFYAALARHTGGNPLFIAELLRNLQVQGDLRRDAEGTWVSSPSLNWQRLPERIEAAIAGRIARLPQHWLDWLATASVEGESFTAEVLARVHGLDEPALVRDLSGPLNVVRGAYRLLQFDGVQWLGSQRLSRYRFRHALFQTYLYEQMDPAERSRRHAAVGQALERLYAQTADSPQRHAAELARHFEAAGLAEQAAGYWLQAGQYALYLSAAPAALVNYRCGLALLQDVLASPARRRLEIRLNIGLAAALLSAADWSGAARGQALQRALDLLHAGPTQPDLPELFPLLFAQANWLIGQSQVTQAVQLSDEMLALAGDTPSLPLALACWSAGTSRLFIPNFPAARDYLQRALDIYAAIDQPPTLTLIGTDLEVMCRSWLAFVLAIMGCVDRAWELTGQARARVEQLGKDTNLGGAMTLAGEVAVYRGDQALVQSLGTQLLLLGQQYAMPLFKAYGLFMQGEAELLAAGSERSRAQAAVSLIRQGMQIDQMSKMGVMLQSWFARLALAHLKAGEVDAGLAAIADGLAYLQSTRRPGKGYAELHRLRGELLLAQAEPQPDEAEQCFTRALEAGRQSGALMWELRAAVSLARLWQTERPEEAWQLLAEVYGRFTESWNCPDMLQARALLSALQAGGDAVAAIDPDQ